MNRVEKQVSSERRIKKNVKMIIAYDGTMFSGWQKVYNTKDNKPSIQALLEQKISSLYGKDISIIGSGRTDSGVHALGQVANYHIETLDEPDVIKKKINQVLPCGIVIVEVEIVDSLFHSRYDAKKKTYRYRLDIRQRESVFARGYTYPVGEGLCIEKMKKAAECLIGTHDFNAFCTDRNDGKSTIRTIYGIEIYEVEENDDDCLHKNSSEVWIEITGNGFLYHMVRIISGTLLEVGLNKRTIENVKKVLESGKRKEAGIKLFAEGLYLKEVFY